MELPTSATDEFSNQSILVIDEEVLDSDIPDSELPPYRPSVIALSSGGTKGLGQVGTLSVLYDEGILSEVDTYIGTSVGGVIALLLVIGCTPHEILEVAVRSTILKPWSQMNKLDKVFLTEYGFVPHELVTAPLRALVEKKMNKIPTLLELYEETSIRLVFVSGNLTDRRVEYLDYISEPDMSCIEAMTSSMLIPGLISKFRYKGKLRIDGAFVDPYPAHYFDDGEREILGLAVIGTELDPDQSYFSYVYAAMCLAFDSLQAVYCKKVSDKVRTIELHLPDISVLDRAKDINKRLKCYNAGVLEGMRAVAAFRGKSYEEYYGSSILPDKYSLIPTFEVKRKTRAQENARRGRAPNRFASALGRIPVPRFG